MKPMRTKIKDLLASNGTQDGVTIKGWVRTKRGSKNVSFIAMNDGSTINNIQVVANNASFDEDVLKRITTGACLSIVGNLIESQGAGQSFEVEAQEIKILGDASTDEYPLQPKRHSLEFLREIAHLRPRTNYFSAVLRIRNAAAFAVHEYFNQKGFVWMHTPIITGSDA
ncbi:MAG: asparaginyl-tRNA synthetase, partial [Salibacteraceae bacterium]